MPNPIVIFAETLTKFKNHSKWDDAAFGKIKLVSNTYVGDIGQSFIEQFCTELGLAYTVPVNTTGGRRRQGSWDICIGGVTLELKTATEDVNSSFQFNHIRYHRDYQGLLCLAVTPDNLFFNIWSKSEVATGIAGALVSMEKAGNASYKLSKRKGGLKDISEFKASMDAFISRMSPLAPLAPIVPATVTAPPP